MRYEDITADAVRELRRMLDFVGLSEVKNETIRQAVEYAKFDNMRKLEESGALDSFRLQPGDKQDPESYKTRRGRVEGFREYLGEDDIHDLDKKIKAELSSFFGY